MELAEASEKTQWVLDAVELVFEKIEEQMGLGANAEDEKLYNELMKESAKADKDKAVLKAAKGESGKVTHAKGAEPPQERQR